MKGRFPVEQSIGDYACDLLIITEAEKEDEVRLMGKLESIKQKIKNITKGKTRSNDNTEERKKKCPEPGHQREIAVKTQSNTKPQKYSLPKTKSSAAQDGYQRNTSRTGQLWNSLIVRKHHKIGIFSRSAVSDYDWLQTYLRTEFRDLVVDVRPCYIPNNERRQFWEDVSQCTFGILYHTMRRGKLNITNVMDSLYDEELKYMAEVLGKENVFVVADDLEDSSSIEKHRILAQQPSIGEYSCDLVLLTPADKENKAQKTKKLETIRSALHFTSHFVHLDEEKDEDDQIKRITEEITSLVKNLPEPVKKTIKEILERLDCAAPEPLKIYFKQNKGRTLNLIQFFKNFYLKQNG